MYSKNVFAYSLLLIVVALPISSQQQQTVFAQQQQPNELEKNKALVKSFVENVFNKHNVTAVDKYYTPNLIQHNPMAGQGQEGFKQYFRPFFSAFPDAHATIEHILGENDLVLVFLNWTGTQKGEFQGMPATNKPFNMKSADLFRIATNGTIAEHWDVVDSLNLLRQTGVITFNQPNTKE
jgi:steroid delta-isomerase-like uncharacterized protein